MLKIILLLVSLSFSGNVLDVMDNLSITETEADEIVNQQSAPNLHLTEAHYSLYIVVGLLITAVFIMKMVLAAITGNKHHSPHDIVMGAGLVIVIFATLFLVIAATSTEAMMAAIGIISSVGGYVLGNAKKDKDQNPRKVNVRKGDKVEK